MTSEGSSTRIVGRGCVVRRRTSRHWQSYSYEMKPQGISSRVGQQQVSEKRNGGGGGESVKSWAEKSVWSLVCAMELGLISEPSLKSASFGGLSNDGSLVKTSAVVSEEFLSINSPIAVANRSARKPLGLRGTTVRSVQPGGTARGRGRRTGRKRKRCPGTDGERRSGKSATTERNVDGGWRDREPGRARTSSVQNFWKSCKSRPGKRENRNCRDYDFDFDLPETNRNLRFDETGKLEGFRGRPIDRGARSLAAIEKENFVSRENGVVLPPGTNFASATASARTAPRTRERLASGSGDNGKGIVEAAKANAKAKAKAKVSEMAKTHGCGGVRISAERKEDAFVDDREDEQPRSSWINTELIPKLDDVATHRDTRRSPIEQNPRTNFDEVHTLPLAQRVSTGSESPLEEPSLNRSRENGERNRAKRRAARSASASGSIDLSSVSSVFRFDVEGCDASRSTIEKRRGKNGSSSEVSRDEDGRDFESKSSSRSASKSAAFESRSIGASSEKQASPCKRSKMGPNGNAIDESARDAVKSDTVRTKIPRKDEEYQDITGRRVTRGSTKISKENFVGKLVWGCCSGWWPALIIDADHVGMLPEAGKLWVYWIGEARISLLNEKTQIESFSCNVKHRLTQNLNVARVRAVDATMQMLRKRLACTLTKPYSTWIENNFSDVTEVLDEIKFYPYPPKIQRRLDFLKERNAKVTEKYLLDQKRESQPKKLVEKAKESPQQNDMDLTRLPLREQNAGVIAWAKISGHNWWPAMIIDYRDCCMREPSFGCQWIMWYGDHKLSEVHHQSFLRFEKGIERLRDYINNTKKHLYLVGVLQASKDHCFRLGCETDDWTLTDVFKYFSRTNSPAPAPAPAPVPAAEPSRIRDSIKIYDKYSAHIVQKLNELKNEPNIDDKRADDIKNSDDLRSVTSGEVALESLCLKCLKIPDTEIEAHPFFEGSLCIGCSEQYKPCMFLFGNDSKCFYCTVCAASGMMIICDNEDCPRVYCTACMKHLLCPDTYDRVLREDPWECFLCKRNAAASETILRPRANWKDQIIDMFRTKCGPTACAVKHCGDKRKIRVLSLFDGLSTGLLVLQKLGLLVDVYYASEIDPDALMVSATHFGDRVTQLGDTRNIARERIKEIAPIDLLIGGSPCNDLSLANPARLGLFDPKGTGVLFFDYCRIMKLVKKLNNGRHLFWLYENVASMPSEYRLAINKHLGQEPDVIDSADFSPQHRLRLYWHNLPIEPHSLSFQGEQDVQDILTPHCQRYALVKKIRTVTTKVNSLKQGKLALKPILMKDESDSLWITELEEIFGFPRHYTDVKNLSATKRQRLIGKSWSVQTLTAIFKSICPFFECNTTVTDESRR